MLFVFNIFGLFFAFKIKQSLIKKEMKTLIKKTISSEKLVQIRQTPENAKEFEWEHSKEFCYHGSMYDVIKKEINQDGSIIYFCIFDAKETSLLNFFIKSISNTLDPCGKANDIAKKISHFFVGFFTIPDSNLNGIFLNTLQLLFRDSKFSLNILYSDLPSPPPKHLS